MKTSRSFKQALMAAALVLASAQPNAQAAFTVSDGFEGDEAIKNGHCFVDFIDGAAQAFWIFKGSTPLYTVGITTTGAWLLEEKVIRHDGSFVVFWEQVVGDTTQFALWVYSPTGALTTAATYSTSGWNPRLDTDGQLLNSKFLIFFTSASGLQEAAWLVNDSGVVEKTFLWADGGGWVEADETCDEFGNIFRILFNNAGARLLTQFVFDGNGNWTGADTFPY